MFDFLSKDLGAFSLGWSSIAIGLITLFVIYYLWRQSFWSRHGIPGPTPLPLLGTTWPFMVKPIHYVEQELIQKYGKIVGLYDGMEPALIIAEPEVIKNVCVKAFQAFPQSFNSKYLHPMEEKFLSTVWGDEWKRIRTLLSPTFTTGKMKKMFGLIQACNQGGMKALENIVTTSDTLDLKQFWGRYNMDVIAKCCFATELNAYSEETTVVVQHFKALTEAKGNFLINFMFPEWLVKLLKVGMMPKKHLDFLHDLALQVIENRKNGGSDAESNDFLQLLLESEVESEKLGNGKLTIDEVIASAVIFLIAGYETTSTLLSWTCWRLALNQDIQERLYQEISEVDDFTYEKVMTLPYLEAVLNESLRIDPPVLQVQRVTHQNHLVPGTKLFIPKGTKISIPVYSLQHDPDNFPEPEIFDPDRFTTGNKDSIKPFTFLPFGAGPRLCIGMRFAMLNAKYALAKLVKNYQLVVNGNTTEKPVYRFPLMILTAEQLKVGIKAR